MFLIIYNIQILFKYVTTKFFIYDLQIMENPEDEGDIGQMDFDTPEATATTSSVNSNKTCLVCSDVIVPKDEYVVKTAGKQKMIEASKTRKDDKHKIMFNLESFQVHRWCYTNYLNNENIRVAARKSNTATAVNKDSKHLSETFNFNKACFFCLKTSKKDTFSPKTTDTVQSMIDHLKKKQQLEDKDKFLLIRLNNLLNKLGSVKSFYHKPCYNDFFRSKCHELPGRPLTDNMSKTINHIIDYILNHGDECQFSVQRILDDYPGERPAMRSIKTNLESHFGDEAKVKSEKGDIIILYLNKYKHNFDDSWYEKKKSTSEEERMRIVETAAQIILQDIRSKCYETESYKCPSEFCNNAEDDVPPTLKKLLDIVIKSYKRGKTEESKKKLNNRVLTAAHVIISNVRPKSFVSPVLLGLSLM